MDMEDKKMGMNEEDSKKCDECMKYHMHNHGHWMGPMWGGECYYCHMGRHKIFKVVFCLIILAIVLSIVFWIGVKAGELRTSFGYPAGGYYMMRGVSPDYYRGMMSGYYYLPTSTSATSAQ